MNIFCKIVGFNGPKKVIQKKSENYETDTVQGLSGLNTKADSVGGLEHRSQVS